MKVYVITIKYLTTKNVLPINVIKNYRVTADKTSEIFFFNVKERGRGELDPK
jgi:hypothetical protein